MTNTYTADTVWSISAYNETPITVWGDQAEAEEIALRMSTDSKAVTARLVASEKTEADYNAAELLQELRNGEEE